jgi:hypothetical protein
MRTATILGAADPMDGNDASDALITLNQMLDSWQAERLFAYSIAERTHTLTAGVGSYTVGPSGVINIPRPVRIEYAFTRDSTNYDRPLSIVPYEVYSQLAIKSQGNNFPSLLYYSPNFPIGTITLWELPSSGLTLRFGAWQPLTEFATLDESVALPPGYELAITLSVAEMLSPEYGKAVSPDLARNAQKARATIQQNNLPDPRVGCEFVGEGRNRYMPWQFFAAGGY